MVMVAMVSGSDVFGTDGLIIIIHTMEHGENHKEIHMYIYLLI